MIANCRVATKTARMTKEKEINDKKRKQFQKEKKKDDVDFGALMSYDAWVKAGKKMDGDGGPAGVGADDVKLFAKALRPRIAPNKKLTDLNTGTKARAWFKEIASIGKSLDDGETDKLRAEMKEANAEIVRNTPVLW